MALRSLFVALSFALAFSVPSLLGRDASPVKPRQDSTLIETKPQIVAKGKALEVSVDGAVTPELIPDDLAHRHFLAALSIPQPDEQDANRRALMLRRVGLSVDEEAALASVLEDLGRDVQGIDNAIKAYDGDTDAIARTNRRVLTDQRSELLDAGVADLRSRLTPKGRQQYDDFVRGHVKGRIKIYRFPGHPEGKSDSDHSGH